MRDEPVITYCPFLPDTGEVLKPDWTRRHRAERGEDFYVAALEYAQSLWRSGKPAQALLQLNQAWSAKQGSPDWPSPYRALVWIMHYAPPTLFLGNPVRHFQHLATRGPEGIRAWRAWGCFHLAETVVGLPRDITQIESEALVIPSWSYAVEKVRSMGWDGEADGLLQAAQDADRL